MIAVRWKNLFEDLSYAINLVKMRLTELTTRGDCGQLLSLPLL